MKKIICFLFIVTMSISVYSQDSLKNSRFGIKIGPNFSNINYKFTRGRSAYRIGYLIGIYSQNKLSSNLNCEYGLNINSKGNNFRYTIDGNEGNSITRLNYLELPINFVYKKTTSKLRIGAGPYFGYAISGNNISKYRGSIEDNEKISFDSDYNHFDAGLNLLVGYQINSNLSLNFNYSPGLINIVKTDNGFYRNNVYAINLNILL